MTEFSLPYPVLVTSETDITNKIVYTIRDRARSYAYPIVDVGFVASFLLNAAIFYPNPVPSDSVIVTTYAIDDFFVMITDAGGRSAKIGFYHRLEFTHDCVTYFEYVKLFSTNASQFLCVTAF